MTSRKQSIIILSSIVFIALNAVAVFSGSNFYPFIRHDMFAYFKKDSKIRRPIIYYVDKNGTEIDFFDRFKNRKPPFVPYNERGFYNAFVKALSRSDVNVVLREVGKQLKRRNIDYKSLRLYYLVCSCELFGELGMKRQEFIEKQCKRELIHEISS